ncbi:chlorophyll a-b binding protein 151, chloroplastic isoform X1 [Physcomitrium patens]|uniref:chlorophyll a-b binding protein 151, chloroplastic isoform X1 n=1 Tax=Physcomitrium patens TaxID=3218 RepID=UPI003CCDA265
MRTLQCRVGASGRGCLAQGLVEFWCNCPDRTIYLLEGLLAKNEIPEYLTGEVPGDYGCYPLGLSMKSEDFDKLEVCCWKVTLSNISELLFPSIWQPQ